MKLEPRSASAFRSSTSCECKRLIASILQPQNNATEGTGRKQEDQQGLSANLPPVKRSQCSHLNTRYPEKHGTKNED